MFKYTITEGENESASISFIGDLDIDGTELMTDEITPKLLKYKAIEIDFKGVYFLDSTGIGLFMKLVKQIQEHERYVSIVNVNEDVKELFTMLHIPQILGEDIFKD
ncbi:STAS domain-containing protein [Halalkalibacterium ligniniphilum]|uniref:STAS domain-containing protein n=1 Tax=Halalkalibacterium ligniniphilum TaxID=1134413 RepID=UPI000344DE92|nr:STAS domain-containing protein [Halalkalibacterium ligniniphilum]